MFSNFDLELDASAVCERGLEAIFKSAQIEAGAFVELKTEWGLWQRTQNLCIEFARDDFSSGQVVATGLAVTTANVWVQELKEPLTGETLVYLLFPIERIRKLARDAYRAKRITKGGDGGRTHMVLVNLWDVFKGGAA